MRGDAPTPGPDIDDCALIGDGRSAALVSRDGAVEWLCWPRFDAPSVFASLLDRERGGTFRIRPAGPARVTRRYRPGTNLLETRFDQPAGALLLTDLQPVWPDDGRPRFVPENELLRRAECLRGELLLEVRYDPRPCYGRHGVRLRRRGPLGWGCETRAGHLHLAASMALAPVDGGGLAGQLRLRAGEAVDFDLTCASEPAVLPPLGLRTLEAIEQTARVWREWSAATRYDGPFRDAVVRSALVLKLLAFAPTGAIIAAPTTSLPEQRGGRLNWDYRYCWLRDASLTARALFGLGHHDEAHAFVGWALHATRLTRPRLEVLYDVYGRAPIREHPLPHLEGYRGARPVLVGNAAVAQNQLDVYGEVVAAAAWFARHGGGFDRETGRMLEEFGHWVCAHWQEPDQGIWELRGPPAPRTHSRVMCWTALDRLVALHDAGLLRLARRDRHAATREQIRAEVERRGFDPALGAYTGVLDGHALDASLLLLPHYGYQPATHPRMRGTVEAIRRLLGAGGPLVRRYLGVDEGAFATCSFWLVECLAQGASTLDDAARTFGAMLARANDVGLFAEEIDPEGGRALGNFPQALTHIGLVNAALTLEEARRRPRRDPVAAPAPVAERRP